MTERDRTKLALLLPHVREQVEALIRQCEAQGVSLAVGNTLRTAAKQAQNVAAGRAMTSRSWHLLGRAADLYVRLPGGKLDVRATNRAAYELMHQEAKKLGFRVLGFKPFRNGTVDPYHVEWRDGMTWDQAAKAGQTPQ